VKTFKDMIPGLDSYRGRYGYISLIASLALMTVAYVGWSQFSRTAESQIASISQRSSVDSLLVELQAQLNLLENQIQRILIEPRPDDIAAVTHTYEALNHHLGKLALYHDFISAKDTDLLREYSRRLDEEISHLLAVRQEVNRWFPAMRLLQEEMYPSNQAVLGELQILLQEAETDLSAEQRLVVIEGVTNLRRSWHGMAEQMHHFIAFRLGILTGGIKADSPEYLANIRYFSGQIKSQLDSLRLLYMEVPFGLDVEERLEQIGGYTQRWLSASEQVYQLMQSAVWRHDLQLMRERLSPLLTGTRQRLSLIDQHLDKESANDIRQLTQTAEELSKAILSIALMGMLMILAAYLYINRNLLKPIAQTAHALKEEARGATDVRPPPAHLRETSDLVEAFNEMRRQVHQRQSYLDHIAHHDALTQLPNRTLFRDRLEHALAIALRGETQVGLMFLDLDQFKQVNDSLGHLIGDELLRTVADRLVSLVRDSDTVARLGGDEFAILVEGISQREDMSLLAQKILKVVEQPMVLDGQELRISVSIGISTAPHDDVSAEYLIRDADAAMYEAKRQGRAAYCFFDGEMTSKATEALQLENNVRQAVEQQEYTFHFQPVIDSVTGELFCFEALMRWNHPVRGFLYPGEFLSVLDQTGLITDVMSSLMAQAIEFQRDQHRQYNRKVAIALNLSVRLLNDTGFRKQLLEHLIARDFLPDSLIIEVTEDILMHDLIEADVFLQQAKTLGARVALDDFGTGQSSLSHLRQFPFDFLKIDREFIHNVDIDANDGSLVKAMVQLAHAFGIQVIAEGVESESQLQFLQSLDCDYLQGYLIGLPSHAEHRVELSQLMPLFVH
jgi:diguanylate cyclase (GGDEF)-like protein